MDINQCNSWPESTTLRIWELISKLHFFNLFHCTCRIGYSATANCCPRMKWRDHLFGHLLLVRHPRRGGNKTTESSWVSSCSKDSKIQSSHLQFKYANMLIKMYRLHTTTLPANSPQTTSSSPVNWHMTLIDIPTPRSFCAPPQVALHFDKDASTSACSSCILALHSDQRPADTQRYHQW